MGDNGYPVRRFEIPSGRTIHVYESLLDAFMLTVNGIAAGMKTTG